MSSPRAFERSNSTVTVYDLAEQAGVSVMTVSRALSGNGYVAKATREKVLAVAENMGYLPNLSAKVLKRTRTNVLGMLVTELRSQQIAQVVSAISAATSNAGQDLFICLAAAHQADSPASLNHLLGGICDGLVLALPKTSKSMLDRVEKSGLPAVLLDYGKGGTHLAVVRGDNYGGACSAVEHLLALGHRRIAFMAGTSFSGQSPERQRGYTETLIEAGIAVDEALIVCGDFLRTLGYEQAKKLLALPSRPTAVFAANDEMALGLMDAARELGIAVPGELSVVGFDDVPAAAYTQPGLTTVRQPVQQIADAAVTTLMRQIETRKSDSQRLEFRSELIVRGTTGPTPR